MAHETFGPETQPLWPPGAAPPPWHRRCGALTSTWDRVVYRFARSELIGPALGVLMVSFAGSFALHEDRENPVLTGLGVTGGVTYMLALLGWLIWWQHDTDSPRVRGVLSLWVIPPKAAALAVAGVLIQSLDAVLGYRSLSGLDRALDVAFLFTSLALTARLLATALPGGAQGQAWAVPRTLIYNAVVDAVWCVLCLATGRYLEGLILGGIALGVELLALGLVSITNDRPAPRLPRGLYAVPNPLRPRQPQ